MAAGLVALRDDQVDPRVDVPFGVGPRTGKGRNHDVGLVAPVDQVTGRRTEGVGHQYGVEGKGDVELLGGTARRERCVGVLRSPSGLRLVVGGLGNLVAFEQFGYELPVPVGDHCRDVRGLQPTLTIAGVLGGHDEVHSIGVIADLFFDPGQVDFQLVVAEGHCTENTHATGLRHGHHHVPAVAEGQNRELDTEHLGYWRTHPGLLLAKASGLRLLGGRGRT